MAVSTPVSPSLLLPTTHSHTVHELRDGMQALRRVPPVRALRQVRRRRRVRRRPAQGAQEGHQARPVPPQEQGRGLVGPFPRRLRPATTTTTATTALRRGVAPRGAAPATWRPGERCRCCSAARRRGAVRARAAGGVLPRVLPPARRLPPAPPRRGRPRRRGRWRAPACAQRPADHAVLYTPWRVPAVPAPLPADVPAACACASCTRSSTGGSGSGTAACTSAGGRRARARADDQPRGDDGGGGRGGRGERVCCHHHRECRTCRCEWEWG